MLTVIVDQHIDRIVNDLARIGITCTTDIANDVKDIVHIDDCAFDLGLPWVKSFIKGIVANSVRFTAQLTLKTRSVGGRRQLTVEPVLVFTGIDNATGVNVVSFDCYQAGRVTAYWHISKDIGGTTYTPAIAKKDVNKYRTKFLTRLNEWYDFRLDKVAEEAAANKKAQEALDAAEAAWEFIEMYMDEVIELAKIKSESNGKLHYKQVLAVGDNPRRMSVVVRSDNDHYEEVFTFAPAKDPEWMPLDPSDDTEKWHAITMACYLACKLSHSETKSS